MCDQLQPVSSVAHRGLLRQKEFSAEVLIACIYIYIYTHIYIYINSYIYVYTYLFI